MPVCRTPILLIVALLAAGTSLLQRSVRSRIATLTAVAIIQSPASDGYVVGMSYKFNKAFAGLAGYALTPVQEPSPGFRAAAIQLVSQNPGVPAYQRFNVSDLERNSRNAYDGFPLFVQTAAGPTTTRVFVGDPTVVHYHGGFVIGVAIPISLRPALTGGQGK
jgi:hypothetical protein